MQIGGGEFRKRISAPTPGTKSPCDASIVLHARPNFREKMKKLNFQAKISPFLRVLFSKTIRYNNVFKKFLYEQTSLVID